MPITVSITVDAVITALGAFLQPYVGTSQIVRAQVNRVPMPPDSFVLLTELSQSMIETATVIKNAGTAQTTVIGPKRIDIQVDFYGPDAGDQCTAVETVYRTYLATAAFPDGIKPLYCSDGHQGPLINGEQQYESRWTLTASLQYNPGVTITSQFATSLAVNILEDLK